MADSASTIHSYAAFGLDVASSLELPELARGPPVDRSTADVVIERGSVDPPAPDPASRSEEEGPLRVAAPEELYLTYPVADLRVRSGREITVDPSPGAPHGVVRSVVVGPAFNHLLHQRGFYVLHASTVSIDGDAVAFVGRSGDGKSTTASAFLDRGHRVLSDDVAAIRHAGEGPLVTPGHPTVKLDPGAVDVLSLPVEEPVRMPVRDRRFFRLPHPTPSAPARLRRVYLLAEGSATEVEPVDAGERLVELVRNTYTTGMLVDPDEATSNFERCARLAGEVGVSRLLRPHSLEELPAVVDAVETDLGVET
ncbi:MAG TPA: hypothetical protein VKA37_13315 [Halobacteriales archaeon]|nr:hypothetical protein [Halobacteriales archaeon]